MGLFQTYRADPYDEVVDGGQVRNHYGPLVERMDTFDAPELDSRVALTEAIFRRQGITFAVLDSEEGIERTWPLDLIPRIITAEEWQHIAAGLEQRVRALNLFLDDLYTGDQEIINDGIVPRWLIE